MAKGIVVFGKRSVRAGGGSVVVNADGSITLTPAAGRNATLASGQLLLPDGTATAPGLSWSASTDLGMTRYAPNEIAVYGPSSTLQIVLGNLRIGLSSDLWLYRDAANTLAQRNGTNVQEQRWYETFTDASNYARLAARTAAGDYLITPEAAGTGTLRGLQLVASGGRVGFFGVTAAARASAYTQTYATADKTHALAGQTAVATTAATQTSPFGYTTAAQADDIVTQINNARTDILDVKQLVNSIIDDLQAYGLLQ